MVGISVGRDTGMFGISVGWEYSIWEKDVVPPLTIPQYFFENKNFKQQIQFDIFLNFEWHKTST